MTTAQELRKVITEIRRKPYPIANLIPLLDKAATELERNNDNVRQYLYGVPLDEQHNHT